MVDEEEYCDTTLVMVMVMANDIDGKYKGEKGYKKKIKEEEKMEEEEDDVQVLISLDV